jgi:hypothetical protein
MEYRTNNKNLPNSYSKEEIEKFIREGKITSNTKIWKQDWYDWRNVKDTEFNHLLSHNKTNIQWKPYIIGILIGLSLNFFNFPELIKKVFSFENDELILINYETNEQLEVSQTDFENQMSKDEAEEACSELGNGWRLPNSSELKIIYNELHMKGKGNFKDEAYWGNDGDLLFNIGTESPYDPNFLPNDLLKKPKWVRAVRTIKLNPSSSETVIIEKNNTPSYDNKCEWCGKGYNNGYTWNYCSKQCYYFDNNR